MTDKEKLAIVEKQLRKRRLSGRHAASLMRQHERLTKKIAGIEPRIGRPPGKVRSPEQEYAFVIGMSEADAEAYLRSKGLTIEDCDAYVARVVATMKRREAEELAWQAQCAKEHPKHPAPASPVVKSEPAPPTQEIKADVE